MTEQEKDKGVIGIANMRNTCYLNVIIQALRHNTEMTAFFMKGGEYEQYIENKPESAKLNLVKGYADIVQILWSGYKPSYIKPGGFLQAMMPAAQSSGFEHFLMMQQHDSHEFLVFLLDQLHEGIAKQVNVNIVRPIPISERDITIQNALVAWKNSFEKQYSPLVEMIYGLLKKTSTCLTCNSKYHTWDTFNCLKLPMPMAENDDKITFESQLKEEFKDEEIEGYSCDVCNKKTSALRTTEIWRLPRMLCISLKRFTYDGKKIHTAISHPKDTSFSFETFFSEHSPEPSKFNKYECFAIVDHHGQTGGGHYTAQAKSPLTNQWNIFDDESTHSMENGPQFGSSTYIIFLKCI